jgi:hypothetical protein
MVPMSVHTACYSFNINYTLLIELDEFQTYEACSINSHPRICLSLSGMTISFAR